MEAEVRLLPLEDENPVSNKSVPSATVTLLVKPRKKSRSRIKSTLRVRRSPTDRVVRWRSGKRLLSVI
jgi:hypothetical protein